MYHQYDQSEHDPCWPFVDQDSGMSFNSYLISKKQVPRPCSYVLNNHVMKSKQHYTCTGFHPLAVGLERHVPEELCLS